MGIVEIEVTRPDLDDILNNILPKAVTMMDNVADTYKDYLETEAPVGETHELSDLSMWESLGPLERFIFSASGHFDPIVKGHKVYGPIFSDLQRRWWFWYLWNVLGGEYENTTNGMTEPNDYPQVAFDGADSDIDGILDDYLQDLLG